MMMETLPMGVASSGYMCSSSDLYSPLNSPLANPLFSPASDPSSNAQDQTVVFQFPSTASTQQPQPTMTIKEEWPSSTVTTMTNAAPPSPMAISPNMSTLNTPRGSITSMRSHQQSPMNTEVVTGMSATANNAIHEKSFLSEPFLPYSEPPATAFEDQPQPQPPSSSSSFYPLFTSSYPSPPGSGYASPVHSEAIALPPPPSYEQHMSFAAAASNFHEVESTEAENAQQTTTSSFDCPIFDLIKSDPGSNPEYMNAASPILIQGGNMSFCSTPPTVSSSQQQQLQMPLSVSSTGGNDTCPETPDSSVRDEKPESNLICQWVECNQEFESQKLLVEHVIASHVESSKKGSEERFCLWQGCTREKGFNAKYKLSAHMRTHTKETPYKCEVSEPVL